MRRTLAGFDHASDDEIRRDQERRLRLLVRLAAARSPFYRSWFRESGVDPRSIRTLADLGRLPLLERRHLAERPEDFRVYPRRLMWAARSSGSSGTPITVYRTPGSSVYELAALERQWSWFGLPRGARRAVLGGSTFATVRPGQVTFREPGTGHLLISSYHLTPENLPTIVAALRNFAPEAIQGWPSSIALLAALLRDAGEQVGVRAIVTSSEVMSPAQRAVMREVFVGPIVDHYGQTERVAMAGSCEAGGYHVFPDYGIVELLPVEGFTGHRDAGQREIVGTPLHNWGFPLFRYQTGDRVGPAPAGLCPCGRSFPRLGSIDGRSEDMFTASDGRPIPVPSAILDDLTGLLEAQVLQRAPGRFEIRMVPGVGFDRAATEARARVKLERLAGPGQLLSFQTMDRLPPASSGKIKAAAVVPD
ncbi:MAG: phenylacetate--CoA ligase family protein [Pseudonocardiales bacterium]